MNQNQIKNILITSIGCAPASAIARTLMKDNKYFIIGIDIQDECVGNFITNKYIKCLKFTDPNYWEFIYNLIRGYNITHVFPTYSTEIIEWSQRKSYIKNNFNCIVFVNDLDVVNIADNKLETYKWCCENNINIPIKKDIINRPIIIKPIKGCGSNNIEILRNTNNNHTIKNFSIDEFIIQEFIDGLEYTIDVIADPEGNIINVIPKERLLIKNGQSFKSVTRNDEELIDFARRCSILLGNKSIINIQVIRDKTGKIYLIEINPRFPTTINLSIESGVNIPVMMIENDFKPKTFINNLVMIRDYHEYFMIK